jgi:hypothetical protein
MPSCISPAIRALARAERERIGIHRRWENSPKTGENSPSLQPIHRAGITLLREQYERASAAERRAAMRLARTKPTTLAGAAVLIAYTRRDIMKGEEDWQTGALKTVASALTRMSQEPA